MVRRLAVALSLTSALVFAGTDAGAQDAPPATDAGPPSIIHPPSEDTDRADNDLGVAVAVVMLVGWGGTGLVMFRRAAKRRAQSPPVPA